MTEPIVAKTFSNGVKLYKINYNDTDISAYLISKSGNIYSTKTKRYLLTHIVNGYEIIILNNKSLLVHRLVALTFIPTTDTSLYVDHIDNNKTNNCVENLQWVTQKENIAKVDIDTSHPRAVIKKDLEGNFIERYKSVTEAGEANGVSRYAISKNCLKINKTCAGHIFEYEDDEKHSHELINITDGKPVTNYENYLVFANGSIYNTKTKKTVKPIENASGYCYVTLSKTSEPKKNAYVHTLVAKAFIENPDPKTKTQVNHKNKIRNDNRVENLEWASQSENLKHSKEKQVKHEDALEYLIEYCNDFNKCPEALDCYEKYSNYTIGNFFALLKSQHLESEESDIYKELSVYPLVKANFDEYIKKPKIRMSYEEGVELCFEYANTNNKAPHYQEIYKGYPIGAWYRQKRKEIRSKEDEKYIKLSKNPIIKNNLENMFKKKDVPVDPTPVEKNMSRSESIKLLIKYVDEFGYCPASSEKYSDYSLGKFFAHLKSNAIESTESPVYKELADYPIIKENLDKYLEGKNKKITFDDGLKLCIEYVAEQNIVPNINTNYKNFSLGKWYSQQKKEIKTKTDKKYICMSVNQLIKTDLDKLFNKRNKSNEI